MHNIWSGVLLGKEEVWGENSPVFLLAFHLKLHELKRIIRVRCIKSKPQSICYLSLNFSGIFAFGLVVA